MSVEKQVAAHYGRSGSEKPLLDALRAAGKDVDRLTTADLAPVDEFHLGWRAATVGFGKALAFPSGAHVLDIGSGIGGPARYLAETFGVTVTGIDLTPEYVALADALTRRVGLADRVAFREANALALPFDDASFDGAYTIHVAMNIADKAKLIAETRRVLKPGATFGIYDVMRVAVGDLPYPLPWALTGETSFVEPSAAYRQWLGAAGFTIVSERDRSAEVKEIVRANRERLEREGSSALGPHTLMGPGWAERSANAGKALQQGLIAPVEIIARAA
ncbi:MAG: methyltransferase domain-containing protein [Rhizobiales bacterium]|nr:methyltransferase domain-containing protein [Hyphomicrobiales bacterium]